MTSQLRKINNVIEQFLLPLAEAVSGWSTLAAIDRAHRHPCRSFLGSLAELMISFRWMPTRNSCSGSSAPSGGCLRPNPERRHLFRDVPHHGFLHRPPSDGPVQP